MSNFKTIKNDSKSELIIKKSTFITRLIKTDNEKDASEKLKDIKKEFRDATHNCSAWRIGDDGRYQRSSDDGEPQGTAGKPMLEILNKGDITNILVVVTRYFGGIKLGAGGLIRAYAQAVARAIEEANLIEVKTYYDTIINCTYKEAEIIKHLLEEEQIEIEDIVYTENVTMEFHLLPEKKERMESIIIDKTNGSSKLEILGEVKK